MMKMEDGYVVIPDDLPEPCAVAGSSTIITDLLYVCVDGTMYHIGRSGKSCTWIPWMCNTHTDSSDPISRIRLR